MKEQVTERLLNVADDAEAVTQAYKLVLIEDETADIDLPDGTKTPSLNKRIKQFGGQVTSVNGEKGEIIIDGNSLGLGSASKYNVNDLMRSNNLADINGLTQQNLNDRVFQYAENIEALKKIKPRKNGDIIITKGYTRGGVGGAIYFYDSSSNGSGDGEYVKSDIRGAWIMQPNKVCSPEQFGGVGDGITNDSLFFARCSLFAEKYNLNIVGESVIGYFLQSGVDIYNSCKVAGLFLSADPTRYGHFIVKTRKKTVEIPFSSLGGLTEGSSKITGFPPSAVGKYIRLSSSETPFTERNNGTEKQYYYKNTTFNLMTAEGIISPSLDIAFNVADKVKAEVFPFESKLKIEIGNIDLVGLSVESLAYIGVQRDNCELIVDHVETTAKNFKTLLSISGNNTTIRGALRDTNIDGYGYAISISNCCDTFIYDMKASNGRTELDGRHGSNVFVYNSKFSKAGTHWGNNYTFVNCDIGAISWSGRDLNIEGGTVHAGVTNRTDICLSTGRFYANNVTTGSTVFLTSSGAIPADFFTTYRCFFDEVVINNLRCTADIQTIYGFGVTPQADIKAPSTISIDNVHAPRATRLSITIFPLDNALVFPKQQTINISNIRHGGVCRIIGRGFSKNTSNFAYNAYIHNCGRIEVQADSNYFANLEVERCEVVSARNVNNKTALGNWDFINCKIKRDNAISPALFNSSSPKGFLHCEYNGDMTGVLSLGGVRHSISCRATIGSTNYPTPLNYYVNPSYYIETSI